MSSEPDTVRGHFVNYIRTLNQDILVENFIQIKSSFVNDVRTGITATYLGHETVNDLFLESHRSSVSGTQ